MTNFINFFVPFWFIFSFSLKAELILSPTEKKLPLADFAYYFIDTEKRYSLDDILYLDKNQKFKKLEKEELNFGYTAAVLWLRWEILNKSETEKKLFLEIAWPSLEYIDFYDLSENPVKARLAGSLREASLKEVHHRNPVFILNFAPYEKKIIYMKISTRGLLYIPAYLYDPVVFYQEDRREQFFYGMFFSVFLIAALYNLFLFFSFKERVYLFFSIFLINLGLQIFVLKGFFYEFGLIKESRTGFRILPALFGFLFSSAALFSREYLCQNTEKEKIFKIYSLFGIALGGIYIFFPNFPRVAIPIFLAIGLVLSLRYILSKENFLGVGFYFLSGLFFLLSVFGFWLKMALALVLIHSLAILGIFGVNVSLAIRAIRRRKEQEKEKSELKRISDDFAIARTIQQNILPESLPESPYFTIEAMFLPKYDLGGDFYDYQLLPDGSLSALLADVTGHGVAAALLAAMLKIAYATERENLKDPARLLNSLDEKLKLKLRDHFITAVAIYLDPSGQELLYAHAGHPPILHYQRSQGAIVELKASGPALGLMEKRKCVLYRQSIRKGDRLLLFTDGLVDLMNTKGEFFGIEKVKSIFLNFADKKCTEFKHELLRQLAYHKGTLHVTDDITFMVIEVLY